MVFSSLTFICVFLPIVYILYLLMPSIRAKNLLLTVASFLFYAYGEPEYVILMVLNVLVNYAAARHIGSTQEERKRRSTLILAVIVNLGTLGVFKYTGMVVDMAGKLLHVKWNGPDIPLPIGISFFTFQALSYTIDVYRKKVDAQQNYLKLFLYVSFFPQLIAGPIVKYRDIAMEIDHRKAVPQEAAQGLRRFICGLGKKVIIANTMAVAVDAIWGASAGKIGFAPAWIGALAYLFQIYYDFSGYSDMAIGLGKMFGFHFKENFQYPYAAQSMQEFWHRWHISLSTWFKEYVYIPLGGNRKGKARAALNKIIVFFLCGLWHGANLTFVVWGLYHGFFLLLEEFVPALHKLPKALGHIYTLIAVCVGFVMFQSESVSQGLFMIRNMFTFHMSSSAASLAAQQLTPWFLFAFALAVIGCGPVRIVADRIRMVDRCAVGAALPERGSFFRKVSRILYILSVLLLVWCMLRLSGDSYNPFIYFRF